MVDLEALNKGVDYLDMTLEEQIDSFFADTLISHTHHDKTMLFTARMEFYQQWCEHTGCAPLAGDYKLGRQMARRFFHKKVNGRKHWFCELRPDLLNDEEIE